MMKELPPTLEEIYPYSVLYAALRQNVSEEDEEPLKLRDIQMADFLEAFNALPEQSKRILELRYRDGRTLETIGREIGTGRENVRRIISVSLKRLRNIASRCRTVSTASYEELERKYRELLRENARLKAELAE